MRIVAMAISPCLCLNRRDLGYPEQLNALSDPPESLFIQGSLPLGKMKTLAMVGTRICTIYGKEMAEKIASEAAACGYVIVSGLARGIDTAAHIGALKCGKTIACIGSGFGHLYPKENIGLAQKIESSGTLITEYPPETPPQKHHFPKRNRLIAALADGILLVEAPLESGAMITMNIALSLGKPCFALPGRADVESFRGNHHLIKTSKAKLVENWREMLSHLEPGSVGMQESVQLSLLDLDDEEQALLSCLPTEEIPLDELVRRSQMSVAKVQAALMGLVLKQAIREFPGKIYKKVS
jgi:DNA processing protein